MKKEAREKKARVKDRHICCIPLPFQIRINMLGELKSNRKV